MLDDANQLSAALERCSAGDQGALREIFDLEGGRMLGVAKRILRRRDLAEEAVQDAFVLIWRKAGQFRGDGGSARGWIYTIVRRRALRILRDAERETPTDPETLALDRDADLAAAARAYARLDEKSRLRDCLATLDETKRLCVLLAYCFGYTHGEIAGRLGRPLGTVKAWVRRGLTSLRACLG